MLCMKYGCKKPATDGGTYCDDHRPPNRMISRSVGYELPGAGDEDSTDTTCECCTLEVHAAVRRPKQDWRWPNELESVFANDEVEITITSSCRVKIDITPDRRVKPPYVTWSEMVFGPGRSIKTRHKVAYYRAHQVLQSVDVVFFVMATCSCSGVRARHHASFVLSFEKR